MTPPLLFAKGIVQKFWGSRAAEAAFFGPGGQMLLA